MPAGATCHCSPSAAQQHRVTASGRNMNITRTWLQLRDVSPAIHAVPACHRYALAAQQQCHATRRQPGRSSTAPLMRNSRMCAPPAEGISGARSDFQGRSASVPWQAQCGQGCQLTKRPTETCKCVAPMSNSERLHWPQSLAHRMPPPDRRDAAKLCVPLRPISGCKCLPDPTSECRAGGSSCRGTPPPCPRGASTLGAGLRPAVSLQPMQAFKAGMARWPSAS